MRALTSDSHAEVGSGILDSTANRSFKLSPLVLVLLVKLPLCLLHSICSSSKFNLLPSVFWACLSFLLPTRYFRRHLTFYLGSKPSWSPKNHHTAHLWPQMKRRMQSRTTVAAQSTGLFWTDIKPYGDGTDGSQVPRSDLSSSWFS